MPDFPSRFDDDRLLTVSEIADYARVSERTVRRWIEEGRLKAVRLGRLVRIRPQDFMAFMGNDR